MKTFAQINQYFKCSARVMIPFLLFTIFLQIGPSQARGLDINRLNLISFCNIYSGAGRLLKQLPGYLCLFMPDGRLISADSNRIAMILPDRSVAWSIPGHFHHRLEWTANRRQVLAISSEFQNIDGKVVRVDVLQKINLNGEVIAKTDSKTLFSQAGIDTIKEPFDWDGGAPKADSELSHFNSIFEIPKLKNKSKMKGVEAGNFIANSLWSGSVIISSDFKKVVAKVSFASSRINSIHTVQVTDTGSFLFFNNENISGKATLSPKSSVEIYNPVTKNTEFSFMSSPPEIFYSPYSGGVQQISPDIILISNSTGAFYFFNMKSRKIEYSNVLSDKKEFKNGMRTQEIRAENLSEFLAHFFAG